MNNMNRRAMSFLLALAMILSMIPSNVFTVFAADGDEESASATQVESAKNEFESNVGKQAIIDVGSFYYGVYVGDEEYAKGNDYGALDEFDYNPFFVESHRFVAIVEEYYHNERGEHWYKLAPRAGEEDQFPLSYPWVLHTTDEEIADNYDPTLAFYGANEEVYFKESYLALANDEKPKTVLFVVAGPAALKDAVIDIQHIVVDEENPRTYPVSPMAFTEEIYNSTFSKAYSIYIGKPVDGSYDENGELITTPWTAADGTISVRYDVDQFGVNTYYGFVYDEDGNIIYDDDGYPQQKEIYIDYGAAFMYAEGELFSADITNMLDEFSDIVYTNSGNSTLVFEHLDPSFELINTRGYFDTDTIAIYSNDMTTRKEYMRSELPKYVNVECFFVQTVEITDEQGEVIGTEQKVWYWISSENLPNKAYFLVPVDYITFMDPTVPKLTEVLGFRVQFAASYLNEDAVVDFLYSTPGFEKTALTDVPVYDLPAVMDVVDTYHTSEDDVYFKLAGSNGCSWPGEYGNHRWVAAEYLSIVTVNYANIAPLMPPVVGESMAVFARNAVRLAVAKEAAERLEATGVETEKIVTPIEGKPGEYTVTLKVHVTGQKTTTITKTEVPTDIILVLDQSGSMDEKDMNAAEGYLAVNGRPGDITADNGTIYVNVGENQYNTVTVTTQTSSRYTYSPYVYYSSQYTTNDRVYGKRNDLYYMVGNQYYKATVTRGSQYGTYTYTYTYTADGVTHTIGTSNGASTPCPYTFYTRVQETVIDSYTFSYIGANGQQEIKTYLPTETVPADTYYKYTAGGNISRLEALKRAVATFAASVHAKAVASNVDHRIAVVGFANYSNYDDYNNSEVFVGSYGYTYGADAQGVYGSALQNMNTVEGYNNVLLSKDALDANGATYVDLGIEMANGILAANPVPQGEKRNRVVVVFTDGTPGYSGSWGNGGYGGTGANATAVANAALAQANITKNTHNATLYTVGIFPGANATWPMPSNANDTNKFMHYLSSNYKTKQSMTSDEAATNPSNSTSYYMSANNADTLNGIFEQISDSAAQGGASYELNEETVVRDIVAPNFSIPNNASGITFYTANYIDPGKFDDPVRITDGSVTSGAPVENQDGTTTLDITGFNFSENWVGTEITQEGSVVKTVYRGKQLIIQFTIKLDDDFLGGDGVDTNGAMSGIYANGETLVEQFEQPKKDIELKPITTVLTPKYIYLGNTVDLTEILDLYIERGDQGKDIKITVDGVNNAYVDLLYTIELNDSTIATYFVPAGQPWGSDQCVWTETTSENAKELLQDYQAMEDSTFTISCVMTSHNNPSNKKETGKKTETVYVYKPTLTFKDSVQDYKKALNLGTDVNSFLNAHFTGVTWSHGSQTATPEGEAPEFAFDFTYSNTNAFSGFIMNSTQDVPVSVTVTIKGHHVTVAADGTVTSTDVADSLWLKNLTRSDTDKITFVHAACAHTGCKFNSTTEEFIVHVINALTSLTIKKDGWKSADPNQTFLFRVTGEDADGNDINLTVTVHGNGSVTIYGLVIGNEYTVTELTDWSWRYSFKEWEHDVNKNDTAATDDTETASGTTNGATITIGEDGTITFTNGRTEEKWLDGDAWCDNLFKKKEENT